jgi:hypothetical protein
MVDRSAQILEITAGTALVAAVLNVAPAACAVHFRQSLAAEELIQPADALVEFLTVTLSSWGAVVHIDRQHVGYVDRIYVAFFAARPVLFGDVFGELSLRAISFARKASCGVMSPAVEDKVTRTGDDAPCFVSAGWPEPEPGAFALSWHSRRISRIAARVV